MSLDILYINELGDLLRDEEVRMSSSVYNIIPVICEKYHEVCIDTKRSSDDVVKMGLLRVMINLVASSDRNRESMVADDQIWLDLLDGGATDGVWERSLIFFTQFIRDSEKVAIFAKFFGSIHLDEYLLSRIEGIDTNADIESSLELLLEIISNAEPGTFELPYLGRILRLLGQTQADEEILVIISDIVFKLTLVDQLQGALLEERLETLLSLLSSDYITASTSVHAKRQLFASCGNISSMENVDNFMLSNFCIDGIATAGVSSGYFVAASSIVMGNCISSVETRDRLISQLPSVSGWIGHLCRLMTQTFNDVVQFQAVHLLVNVLTSEVAEILVGLQENMVAIFKSTKIVKDNKDYYQEINKILNKFVRKLVRLTPDDIELNEEADFRSFWKFFENDDDEILYYLLQREIKPNKAKRYIYEMLLVNMVRPIENIGIEALLEKLKTLGIFFQLPTSEIDSIIQSSFTNENSFFEPYLKFLESLQPALAQENVPPILTNNSKFVAATTKTYLENGDAYKAITDVCNNILQL